MKCRDCGIEQEKDEKWHSGHPDLCYSCCTCFDYHEDCEYCGTDEK